MSDIQTLFIPHFTTHTGAVYDALPLHFQHFGSDFRKAPVVLVNHSLTGDSRVSGKDGWWTEIVGPGKVIDTRHFAVIAFNIPGNGVNQSLFDDCKTFHTGDIATLFYQGLQQLGIENLHTIIGGSIGGGIAWEMAAKYPTLTARLIPIAADWKASDWVLANTYLQERILENSSNPVQDARIHAMLTYRTPESLGKRFERTQNKALGLYNVESWLLHHGKKLQDRFDLKAYRMMNALLASIDITRDGKTFEALIAAITADIHIIAVDSDLLFSSKEDQKTYRRIKPLKNAVFYHEIASIHGHDAFLMENEKMIAILQKIMGDEHTQQSTRNLQEVI